MTPGKIRILPESHETFYISAFVNNSSRSVMGGMGSLSFENVFSPEAADRAEASTSEPRIAINGAWPYALQSDRLSDATATARVYSEASPWVTSSARRVLDFVAAFAALIFFLPVMLLTAVLVRFGSFGPVLFRQRRMGRNGKEFTLYKFRSMRPAGVAGSSIAGSTITVAGDSRITAVGAFLRRYKLDELPQFWNVLLGDMGLVGPRPKLPHHEALHMTCRPGITGVATLAFSREEEFLSAVPEHELEGFYEVFVKPAKARLDLEYMRTATFASDLHVLWRTVCSCLLSSQESPSLPVEVLARHAVSRRVRGASAPPQHIRAVADNSVRTASVSAEF